MDWRGRTPSPLLIAGAISLALALASLALPSGPTYDPYAWLIWGRDLTHLGLSTTSGGTSWKPLPALLDAALTPLGQRAADGWLVVARAGALFAVFMAFRLAARLAPRGLGVLAGLVAAGSLVLTREWVRRTGVGDAEGLMVALGLLAVDRHLDERRGQAFAFLAAAALIRVEVWPFAAACGAWLAWRGDRRTRLAVAIGALSIPLLWFGGDWVGSGHLTTAAGRALRPVPGSPGASAHPAQAVAEEAYLMLPAPAWIALAAALVLMLARRLTRGGPLRLTPLAAIAACAAAWTAIVVAMTVRGYAGLPRFLFMSSALYAVAAGAGAATVAHAVTLSRRRAAVAGAMLLVALAYGAGAAPEARRLPADFAAVDKVADMDARLARSVHDRGGAAAFLRCRRDAPWYTVTALAYDIDVAPGEIHDECPRSAPPPARHDSGGAGSRQRARS